MPGDERNAESGRFSQQYPDKAFLAAIESQSALVGTADVAAEVGCTHDTALKRLSALEAQGDIERNHVAGAILWSLADSEDSIESTSQ